MARTRPDTIALAVTLVAIIAVTLTPTAVHGRPEIDLCLVCGNIGGATALLNVVLFVPFGFFARLRFGWLWRAIAAGFALSFFIEATQLFVPGRETGLSDLVANTLGAAIGAGLALRPAAWLLPRSWISRIVALAGTSFIAAAIIAAGPLLDPVAPAGDYYAQWTPRGRTHPRYSGAVVSATLGDLELPTQQVPDPARVGAALIDGTAMHLRYTASPPTSVVVPVFRIVFGGYGEGQDLYYIGTLDSSLVVWQRLASDEWHLSRPTLLWAGALAGVQPGDTVDVRVRRLVGEGYEVAVNGRARRFGFTVGRSWSVIYDVPMRSSLLLALVDHLWFLGIAAVIGWYAAGWPIAALAFAIASGAAIATPLATDLRPTPVTLFVAFAAGLVLAVLARRRFSAWMVSIPLGGAHAGSATTPRRSPRSR